MTVGEWLAEWFAIYKKPSLAASSIENIERVMRLHVAEWLKAKPLHEVRALDIDKALSEVPTTRMRKYAHYVLNNALTKAYKLDLLAEDVMRKAETVRHREREGRALTMAEQEDFLRRLEGHRLRNLFLFYIYTGVRRCEALALRWADVDFARKQITVRGTKTASSFRTLAMLPEVEQLLKEQRGQAAGERVFPWCASHVSKQFKKLCGGHKLHDLRHTFVTRCAESGINVNVAQQLAGHSDIKTTLKTYTHVSADFIKREYIKYTLSPYAERRGN